MCKLRNKNNFESTAQVVDGNLILTLPDAINPIIWRMELGNVRASAIEIRANDNQHILTLKTPRGDIHDIAPFENRDRALHALMQISRALAKAEGKLAPANINTAPPALAPAPSSGPSSGIKWLIAFAAVILLIFLFSWLSGIAPKTQMLGTSTGVVSSPSSGGGESGVPLSADQYLQGF